MIHRSSFVYYLALAVVISIVGCVASPNATGQELPASINALFAESCLDCHDSGTKDGDLDLESLKLDLENPENFQRWERVFDRVHSGEMPPDGVLEPKETKKFLGDVRRRLNSADAERIKTMGRTPTRRLTRSQYERTLQGLLNVDIPLQVLLPADSLNDGFDTVSQSQQISGHAMRAYLETSDIALQAAFNRILEPDAPVYGMLKWHDLRRNEKRTDREPEGRPSKKDVVSWSTRYNFYGRMHATTVPIAGRYRIKLKVEGVNVPSRGSIWCSVRSGVCRPMASTLYWIGSFEATKEPKEYEFTAWIEKDHQLQIRPNETGIKRAPPGNGPAPIDGPPGKVEASGVPGVAIKWIEMERLDGQGDLEATKQNLFGDLELKRIRIDKKTKKEKVAKAREAKEAKKRGSRSDVINNGEKQPLGISYLIKKAGAKKYTLVSKRPQSDLRELMQRFADRAFRRPVGAGQLKPYVDFAVDRLKESGSFEVALRAGYQAVLCSPRFIYLEEHTGQLDDHSLASRLSYFLTGTMPDEELRSLADEGKLSDPNVLRTQTERILKSRRAATFVKDFTDQWLKLYELEDTTPDGKLYPEYDDILHHSFARETHAFVWDLIYKNLPVTNVVDSDFTYLTSRLARHYKIDWPQGKTGLQKIKLQPKNGRGGIITQASVLKVTANGTSTSPIIRGVWMLERIMGQHVPPPPANVPAVEPDIRGATTIREQMEKHKNIDECAACHVKIDPPGFALESYDVIGGYRKAYRVLTGKGKRGKAQGPKVDPSASLASGETFKNLNELKRILSKNPEQLARNLASHLVTYATGARPTFSDREAIEKIVMNSKTSNYGVRTLIHEVVQSPLFRNK